MTDSVAFPMTRHDNPANALRAGMRRLAASVCVLTARDADGQRHAMTATAVSSVSDNPASLLVCVNRQASLHALLVAGQPFAVNVLNAAQADISARCAGSETGEARFAHAQWQDGEHQLPWLANAEAVFFCEPAARLSHGTHLIVIGNITSALVVDSPANPLLYADGQYRQLSAKP